MFVLERDQKHPKIEGKCGWTKILLTRIRALVALEHHPDGLSFGTRGGALAAKGRRFLGNGRVLRGEAAAQ